MKPKVFVASSVEGLKVAYKMQTNLQHDADLTCWSQGVFSLSVTPIDSITEALAGSDFGIFVFSADDTTMMRGSVSETVRDNVLFELGLFIGRLSKRRCFIVMPDNVDIHIPSDLMGVTPATYSGTRDISELAASLGPACEEIRTAMKLQGLFASAPTPATKKIPANDHDNLDDNDKIAMLEAWLYKANDNTAHTYLDIDNRLKMELGSSKKLLGAVLSRNPRYKLKAGGGNVFSFSVDRSWGR